MNISCWGQISEPGNGGFSEEDGKTLGHPHVLQEDIAIAHGRSRSAACVSKEEYTSKVLSRKDG